MVASGFFCSEKYFFMVQTPDCAPGALNIVLMPFATQFGDLTKFNLILGFNGESALLAMLAKSVYSFFYLIFMHKILLKFC